MPVNYQTMYDQSMGMYGGILGGYASALAQQQAAQNSVMSGFNSLQGSVLGGLATQGQTRSADIAANYTARQGREMQNLISRGLGNSTIQSSVTRGLAFDEQRAQNALAEDVARMNAEYQSRLGLASLGYQAQAAQQNSALLSQQLGYQSGWQSNLLGASLRGLAQQDPWNNPMMQSIARGGIRGGSGGRNTVPRLGSGYGGGGAAGTGIGGMGATYPGWTPEGAGMLNLGGRPASFGSFPGFYDPSVGGGDVAWPSGDLLGSVAGAASYGGYSDSLLGAVAGGFDPGYSGEPIGIGASDPYGSLEYGYSSYFEDE